MPSALGERAERERRQGNRPTRPPQGKLTPTTTRKRPPALGRGPDPGRRDKEVRTLTRASRRETGAISRAQPQRDSATHTQHKPEAPPTRHRPTQPNPETPGRGSKSRSDREPRDKQVCFDEPATADDIQADSDQDEPLGTPADTEPSKSEKIAIRRNRERVERADAIDQKLLSKYLPETANDFLPNTIPGPDDNFTPPAWLMIAIKEVLQSETPIPRAPPVHFELSEEAIQKNSELLQSCNLDMHTLLSRFQDTTLGFGPEFAQSSKWRRCLGSTQILSSSPRCS